MEYDIQYKEFREEVRAYCEEKIGPYAVEIDRDQFYSKEVHQLIQDMSRA